MPMVTTRKSMSFYAGPSFVAKPVPGRDDEYAIWHGGKSHGIIYRLEGGKWGAQGPKHFGHFPNARQAGIAVLKAAGVIS